MSSSKREITEVTVSAGNIILDIEGTTTSISFVKDVLFPYVRKHVEDFVKQNLESDSTKTIIDALRSQAKEDEDNKLEGVVAIPESVEADKLVKAVVDNVFWQMDNDRKTKGLKDLQGLIYEEGYKKGDLKGHVYEDVEPCLKAWTTEGKSVYIYSSGSVQAQKLLYGHSEKGDLLTYIKGHFDTTVGMKNESQSYKKILEEISCNPSEAVFLTDVPKEARAAKEAGILAMLVSRDGNAPLAAEDQSEFKVISSFDEIKFEENSKKRKLSPENDVVAETDNKEVESCPEPVSETPEVPKVSSEEEKMDVDEVGEQKPTEAQNTTEAEVSESSKVASGESEKEVAEAAAPVSSKTDETVISSSDDSKQVKEETPQVSKPSEDSSVSNSVESDKEVANSEKVQSSTEESVEKEADKETSKKEADKEMSKKEADKETSSPDSTEDKPTKVTEPVTDSEKVVDSTEKSQEKTDSEPTEKKTEPEESSPSEVKAVAVEETKESTTEPEKVPEEVSKVSDEKAEVPKEDATKEESKIDSSEETKVTVVKDDSKPSEEKEEEPKKEEAVEKKEEKKEVVAVNGEAKTNGASHNGKTPNGDLTNGAASPEEKTNGTLDEAVENGNAESEKPVKAGKLASSEGIVIES